MRVGIALVLAVALRVRPARSRARIGAAHAKTRRTVATLREVDVIDGCARCLHRLTTNFFADPALDLHDVAAGV